jgi:hypothetical protein
MADQTERGHLLPSTGQGIVNRRYGARHGQLGPARRR